MPSPLFSLPAFLRLAAGLTLFAVAPVLDAQVFTPTPSPSPAAGAPATAPVRAPMGSGQARTSPAKILLKVDDFRGVNPKWVRFMEIINKRKLHAGIGIIADSLATASPETIKWIKDVHATKTIEFWNHGFDHKGFEENGVKMKEFQGAPLERQKEHLVHADALMREKTGFPFQSFGAPENATDANTVPVLMQEPDIKVWLFGDKKQPAGKIVLDRVEANIESPIFKPNLAAFQKGYAKYPQRDYFLIQGHPPTWGEPEFQEFERMLDFMIQEKCVFMTPSEYAKLPMP